ncbi:membrane integrity-associated transporter subunit PqiC [Mariprofundus erugo]|uniref:Membrane integrity-associated transporter subunit PqiC n=1 Tax=Mariprofundus erugo TaxID=2528639 RepID=A0A5R9GSW1_9PROT|nr:PqiC family protein [Mariprofundus erugo]TLS69000.1 membrane integrity-associated transporter subunit PqiC [Mariprofundus erugo]
MRATPIRTGLIVLLAGLTAAACTTSKTTASHLYVLTPMTHAETAQIKSKLFTVAIARLMMPAYLDRPQIVSRSSSHQLLLAEAERWGGNLNKNTRQVMADNLAIAFESSNIGMVPVDAEQAPRLNIEIEVSSFEAWPDGKAHLAANWRIINEHGDIIETRSSELTRPISGKGYEAIVQSMSLLLADLSREIAAPVLRIYHETTDPSHPS